jgi:Ca2+-transporting ATPase
MSEALSGLTAEEARAGLAHSGPNEIQHQQASSVWKLLRAQLINPLVLLLVGACAVSAWLGEIADAIAIAAIVLINGIVGFVQEHRAERAVQALRSMTAPRARVVRDGKSALIPAAHVVSGDVLLLQAGDIVAADARLLEANALSTIEAALTGESQPSRKSVTPSAPDAPLAERQDRVFMGTSVATGTARAKVTATGMRTELGTSRICSPT